MNLAALNALDVDAARVELKKCCGSFAWIERMLAARPFADEAALFARADELWWALGEADWLEAFAAHPRIGSQRDVDKKTGTEKAWSAGEQSGAARASDDVKASLARANAAYEQRFGFIYIVCATGKSAEEMLALAEQRLGHERGPELRIAAEEQRKITRIRLRKLLDQETP